MPTPLTTSYRPVFPCGLLPGWADSFVSGVAEFTQTPRDLAGMLVLSTLAASVAGKATICLGSGWREPLNLYCAVALPPASRKSPVHRLALDPVQEYERERQEAERPRVEKAREYRRTLEQRLEHVRKDIAKERNPAKRQERQHEQDALVEELSTTPRAVLPRLLVDNATPETLTTLLAAHGGHLFVAGAEGGELFAVLGGRYSGNPNIGVFLHAHSGDSLTVDRRDRSERIESPLLTVALTVQPSVIEDLASVPSFRGRGLLGRFLYAMPPSNLGKRRSRTEPIPESVANAYGARLQALLAVSLGGEAIPCSPNAREALRAFQDRLEPRLHEDGNLAHLGDWAGKLAGHVARVAGVVAIASDLGEVSLEIMERAVSFGEDYLIHHARAAFETMHADPDVLKAQRLLPAVRRIGQEEQSLRELHRAVQGQSLFKCVGDVRAGAEVLIDTGHLRHKDESQEPGRRGRKPSPRYLVNPWVFSVSSVTGFSSSRKREGVSA